jgi:hypothetical protein
MCSRRIAYVLGNRMETDFGPVRLIGCGSSSLAFRRAIPQGPSGAIRTLRVAPLAFPARRARGTPIARSYAG